MAEPMTAAQFLAALKAEGLSVKEHRGWRSHNRNHKGAWGPLNGVMLHHTASGTSGIESFVYNGSDALPGPLCHGLINKNGSVVAIGWGRANHAGGGDPDVMEAVIREDYPLPRTDKHEGESGAVDGNARFVGYECVNKGDGKDPWPAVQLEAMARAAAAVCRFYNWNVNSVIRHLDWSDWKSDPRGVDWGKMRGRISEILRGEPNATPISDWTDGKADEDEDCHHDDTPSKPKPKKPVVDLSRVRAAARRDPGLPQGGTTYPEGVKLVEKALDRLNYLSPTWSKDGSFGTKTITAYSKLQRHLGYRGADADGVPGKHSLTWLGQKTGLFTVKD